MNVYSFCSFKKFQGSERVNKQIVFVLPFLYKTKRFLKYPLPKHYIEGIPLP